jgi:cysteine synthase
LLNINFALVDGYIQFASEEAEEARLSVLESEGINVGLTTSGCLAALKKLPMDSRSSEGQNILIVAHDTYQRSRHEPYHAE